MQDYEKYEEDYREEEHEERRRRRWEEENAPNWNETYLNTLGMSMRICPICNREYTERPAMSRADNKTPICPTCGMLEAVQSVPAGAMPKQQRAELEKFIVTKTN